MSTTNVRATKATGARAKKESGKTSDSSAHVANTPNAETQAAFAEAAEENLKSFDSVEELRAYLEADD